ncbi:MAG: riboflavin synthase [Acidiferrobacteraceae bacterium]|nr:riboflavin synthase [Acidiferrobacteraceae bacterium]|tara:strand:- start:2391 stop:2999 length:609 start_codon:yes stop_codon:yes gene_type:complete
MFTGIVEAQGIISNRIMHTDDVSLEVELIDPIVDYAEPGDSVAVNGACLTVTSVNGSRVSFDLSVETLNLTTLGNLPIGGKINLERPVTTEGRFGGHLVSGHIDGLARLKSKKGSGRSIEMIFECDNALAPYLVKKGSICLDGVSLTINNIYDDIGAVSFCVNVIPHTLVSTTFGLMTVGDEVHVEVDQIARYIERLREFSG